MDAPNPHSVAEALQVALIELESDTGADGRAEAIRWLRAGLEMADRDSLRVPLEGLLEEYSLMLRAWEAGRLPTEDEARGVQKAWNRAVKALGRRNEGRPAIRAALLKALIDRATKHLHEWSSGLPCPHQELDALKRTLEDARRSLAEEASETQGYIPGNGSQPGEGQASFLSALRTFADMRLESHHQLDALAVAALVTHVQALQRAAREALARSEGHA